MRGALLLGALSLAACADKTQGADGSERPRAKPAEVTALLPGGGADVERLSRARISTKSGEILILEPDGSVTTMSLDSPEGRDAFMVTQADLDALNANLDLDLSALVAPDMPRRQTAQERALEEFAARTQPALPALRAGLYGFNSVLVAIALATVFLAGDAAAWLYALLASVAAVFVTAALSAAFEPFGLPALTLPFVLVSWAFLFAAQQFARLRPGADG